MSVSQQMSRPALTGLWFGELADTAGIARTEPPGITHWREGDRFLRTWADLDDVELRSLGRRTAGTWTGAVARWTGRLVSPDTLLRWGLNSMTRSVPPGMRWKSLSKSPCRHDFELTLPEELQPDSARVLTQLIAGMIETVPLHCALPPAAVFVKPGQESTRVDVHLPTSHSMACRLRRAASAVFRPGAVLREMSGQESLLNNAEREIRQLQEVLARHEDEHRRRIAYDLHDGVGQVISAIGLRTAMLQAKLAPEQRNETLEILELVRESMQQIRELSEGLDPVASYGGGLPSALDRLRDQIEPLHPGFEFESPPEEPPRFDSNVETQIFLIVREAVLNAVKHADAGRIRLRVACPANGGVTITVSDDGCGLPEEPDRSRGLGLRIMRHRASTIGAGFRLDSQPGHGTRISLNYHPDPE